jgi:hypothetical protein
MRPLYVPPMGGAPYVSDFVRVPNIPHGEHPNFSLGPFQRSGCKAIPFLGPNIRCLFLVRSRALVGFQNLLLCQGVCPQERCGGQRPFRKLELRKLSRKLFPYCLLDSRAISFLR